MKNLDLTFEVDYLNNSFDNLSSLINYHTQLFTFTYDQPVNAILILTYIPLFLIALLSNILIILVVSRYRYLRSVTNYFLVNLSVADLLVTLICMPVAVGQAAHTLWLYGEIMCKLSFYLQGVAVSAGVFTITAVSIERYLAIRHPMSRKIFNRKTTRKAILLIWTLSLALFAPLLLIRKTAQLTINGSAFEFCVEDWPDNLSRRSFGSFSFIVVYAIPGFIVVLAYSLMGLRLCSRSLLPEYQLSYGNSSPTGNGAGNCDSVHSTWQVSSTGLRLIRERRRVAKLLLILALVFAFCWLPHSVLSLILDLNSKSQTLDPDNMLIDEDEGTVSIAKVLLPFAILLGHVNSAVNPLLCCMLSKNFRRSMTEVLRHPTRSFNRRKKEHCKIRMTFRKDLADSREKYNSKDHVRPRNPHAPDPPPQQNESGPSRSNQLTNIVAVVKPGQTCCNNIVAEDELLALNYNDACILSSPSSSGYSSLRHSMETISVSFNKKDNCTCSFAVPAQLGKKENKKLAVPSTIREESSESGRLRAHVAFKEYLRETNSH